MGTLKDLLNDLLNSEKKKKKNNKKILPNTRETWSRIGKRDDFNEIVDKGTTSVHTFLNEWIKDNAYENIQ